jgi:hypothetical protein
MGTLDFRAREDIVHWCLGVGCMWYETPVEIQHAKKPTELTGGLRWLVFMEVGHSLLQRLRTFGGPLVAEEGDLRCSNGSLSRVDYDAVPL